MKVRIPNIHGITRPIFSCGPKQNPESLQSWIEILASIAILWIVMNKDRVELLNF